MAMKSGYAGRVGRFLSVAAVLCLLAGCARQAKRLEIHWYTPTSDVVADDDTADLESFVEMRWSRHRCPPLTWPASSPDRKGDYTVYSLPEGRYEFEYLVPSSEKEMLYGELDVFGPEGTRMREFLRRTYVTISPGRPGGDPGFMSIITEEDLDRVRRGDMVTKVVFIADLQAVDRRLDMIEQELRRIRDLQTRQTGQLEYWKVKLADRRRNAFYNSEYGVDIPSSGLAAAQTLMGAETYHWYRYTQAEDKVRTYEEQIAELDEPARRLREERAALRGILSNTKIVCRQNEMMLATCNMQERFTDMTDQINQTRPTLQGPEYDFIHPYFASGMTMSLGYWRSLENNTEMDKRDKRIGKIVMIMRLGGRAPTGL